MDIKNIDFIKLFIEKHGQDVYENIEENIYKEDMDIPMEDIPYIFYIAYSDFLKIPDSKTIFFINDVLKKETITKYKIAMLRKKHINSIEEIVKYINKATLL